VQIDLSKYIELRNNRPHIRGRRLPVMFIATAEQTNQSSIADLAYQFTLSEEQVLAALLYYREHKAELDDQEAMDRQESDDLHKRFGKQA
jgi:uncharacterized protein (DUF433 family)